MLDRTLTVKSANKQKVCIQKNSQVKFKCKTNLGAANQTIPVLFEPSVNPYWPEGVIIPEAVASINHSLLQIYVHNPTSRDIQLLPKTKLGEIQLIKSIIPLDVEKETVLCSAINQNDEEDYTKTYVKDDHMINKTLMKEENIELSEVWKKVDVS